MKKNGIILFILVLVPSVLFSSEVYFYRAGKKVVLKENHSNHSFVSDSVIKALSVIPSNVKVTKREGNTFILGGLSSKNKEVLLNHGRVYPAYRDGNLDYFINDRIFVKIPGTPSKKAAEKWCMENDLVLIKQYKYIPQWYLVSYNDNTIKKAAELVEKNVVEQAEPSFFIPLEHRLFIPNDALFFNQWHLHNFGGPELSGTDHAHVANAWSVLKAYNDSLGRGVKLAVIDDGFDLTHEDLIDRFVDGKNFGDGGDQPLPGQWDNHGTACAGVAAASANNGIGVAGACPECSIIPIRMNMRGPSLDQIAIESFSWAAEQGADIISNSWGPTDGGGPVDMSQPLKDLVRNLTTNGRNGKGIIIFFAAGNGNESIESDGFASNPDVFAIGATNAAGMRSSYSDFGPSLDFMAPSNDMETGSGGDGWGGSTFDGIWTTDRTVGGYEQGNNYTGGFGGTSSSCPLAAGITGLVLSANPGLTRDQVYEIYKATSDKVGDMQYDMNGFNTHYGYGRLNTCEAVKMAIEMKGVDVSGVICGESDHSFEDDDPDPEPEPDSDPAPDPDKDTEQSDIDGKDDEKSDEDVSYRIKDGGCSCSFLNI